MANRIIKGHYPIVVIPENCQAAIIVVDPTCKKIAARPLIDFPADGHADQDVLNKQEMIELDFCVTDLRSIFKALRDSGSTRTDLKILVLQNKFDNLNQSDIFFSHLRETLSNFLANLGLGSETKSFDFRNSQLSLKYDEVENIFLCKKITAEFPLSDRLTGVAPPHLKVKTVKVMIVDDSKVIHKLFRELLECDSRFEVVGTAIDPIQADEIIDKLNPDVITLDFQMPRMDGLTYLRNLIPRRKIPVVMISGASNEDGQLSLEALELGAVDFIQKPSPDGLAEFADVMREKLYSAAQIDRTKIHGRSFSKKHLAEDGGRFDFDRIILIGSSTGGTNALSEIIPSFPREFPPIVIVQHIPEKFSALFAERLNSISSMTVAEARDGDQVVPGQVLIAQGGKQLKLIKSGAKIYVNVNTDEPVNRHRPSVDYMFHSAAEFLGNEVVGILLTGMGKDGAAGLLKLKNKGATTIAQNEQSCIVYGMPKAAAELGAANLVLPLDEIATAVMSAVRHKSKKQI